VGKPLERRLRDGAAAMADLNLRQARILLFSTCLALFPFACDSSDAPSKQDAAETGSARPSTAAATEFSREYWTKTGKTIVVSETHPVGQSLSTIQISTRDFAHNRTETFEDRDPISNVLIADLDGNGFDEIYLITTSQGSGSYGSVLGFASNRDKSLSMVNFPDIQGEGETFRGYMGHDIFSVEGQGLVRTFPVYAEGDPNRNPTGGKRKLTYGLHPGEATWQLRIEKSETIPD